MIETFITLAAAHFVADFTLQSDAMVAAKRRPQVMAMHIAIVVATAALALGWLPWPLLLWLAVTHLAMDAIKTHWLKSGPKAFLIDQGMHLTVITVLAFVWPDATERGLWGLLPAPILDLYHLTLLGVAALIAVVDAGGVIIGGILKRVATLEATDIQGLPNGGLQIGRIERALILLLVAIDEPTGVGLLLAAKSILRFGDISNTQDRARAEYIMIGTFLSVGWALAIAVVIRRMAGTLAG